MKWEQHKGSFEQELRRLRWLIRLLNRRLKRPVNAGVQSDESLEVYLVTTSCVRRGISYGMGIRSCLAHDLVDASWPILRSAYELWSDFRYLLREGSPPENARRVKITAALEVSKAVPRSDPRAKAMNEVLAVYKREFPELVTQQRERRHWSGLSRVDLLARVAGARSASVYKELSWEAHSTLSAITETSVQRSRAGFVFRTRSASDAEAIKASIARRAGGVIFYMWNEYARTFNLKPVRARAG